MKLKAFTKIVLSISFIALLFSCKSPNVSPTTGWEYDNSDWGGFESAKPREQIEPNGMVFIEGGNYVMGQTTDNIRYDWNNQPRKATVSSFFMDEYEVTNHAYKEYLHWLNRVYGNDYPEYCKKALPDTLVWRSKLANNEAMVEFYFRHPNYADYPVVGVSWLQAVEYCNWRTDRVNEEILISEGYLDKDPEAQGDNVFNTDAYLAGLYEGIVLNEKEDLNPNSGDGVRKIKTEDGILLPRFRLPTEAEWEYAAYALIGNTFNERIVERRVYPWNGYQVRTDDKKYYGELLANFKRSRGDAMGVAGALNDHYDYTAPVSFYFPNDYGLYNMAGNVAEWCMDVYRHQTGQDADDINPFRGNVYMTKVLDADGMISEKDSLGRISYREVTVSENINRLNYKQADNINYLDGDLRSQLADSWKKEKNEDDMMAPSMDDEDIVNKSETNEMYQYGITSMIDDKARVVKGGSWRDRAYYLSPGQRRFLDQTKSTDWIGFRCAMDRIGDRVM